MRVVRPVLAACLCAAVVAGCGSSGKVTVPNGAVAQVSKQTVTAAALDGLLTSAQSYYKQQKQAFPKKGTTAYASLRGQAIEYLVQSAVLEQQAASMGISVSDSQINTAISSLKTSSFGGSESKFEAALKAQGLTMDQLREQERLSLTESAIQAKVTGKLTISDAAARAYYAKHPGSFKQAASRSVRHILVAKKALADSIYAQLQKGASFTALVKKYSTDTSSKPQGGKLTDVKGTFVPAFEKVAFALKTNEISKPVHSQYGWHIIQALAPIKPATTKPYASVAASIKAQLLQTKQSSTLKAWTTGVYKTFCKDKIVYGTGFAPTSASTNLCASTTTTTTSSTTTTTG